MDKRVIVPARVRVYETTLFDAVCVAMESGEFVQVREMMADDGNGRCAWGVVKTIADRTAPAGGRHLMVAEIHLQFLQIERRAGELLGYSCMEEANDAGEHLGIIAAALRAARIEIEAERNDGS